jgi:pilus assembly protein CpaF
LSGGARKIVQIAEITGCQADSVSMHDIFVFEQSGLNERMEAEGEFYATGIRPECLSRMQRAGTQLPLSLFDRGRRDFDRFDSSGLNKGAV